MSRHYDGLVEPRVVRRRVFQRQPYTVVILDTEWPMGLGGSTLRAITGIGFAKYSPEDAANGLPWDAAIGERWALKRAYKDVYLQQTAWSPQQCRCRIQRWKDDARRFMRLLQGHGIDS